MKSHVSLQRRRRSRGFSLLEIMIVLGIIAILMGGAIALIGGVGDGARVQQVQSDFNTIGAALKMYKINAGTYPTTAQGLQALVERPTSTPVPKNWTQYSKSVPKDPWGNEFAYLSPGLNGDFDLIS